MERNVRPRLPDGSLDVVVVGAGLAGLTAAVTAARGGARAVVVDARSPGGRARTELRDGVSLNLGPHALYVRGAASRILGRLGIHPAGGRPAARGPAWSGGRRGVLPVGLGTVLCTNLLSPASKYRFARFMTGLDRLDIARLHGRTVDDLVDGLGDRDDLRALVHGLVRLSTYANAPGELSAGAAVEQLRLAAAGVRYLDGGWQQIVDALADTARSAGVDVVTGTTVERLTATSGGWRVVTAVGELRAGRVVLAGLAPEAVERLADLTPGALRDLAGPAARAACLDLVGDGVPPERFALDLDRALYASVHSEAARLTPDGVFLMSLARYRPPDEDGEPATDRRTMTDFARRIGVEVVRDHRYLHDMVVAHGIPLARRDGLTGRPAVDALEEFERPGLLLAGDWVGPEGFLADAAVASGALAGTSVARAGAATSATA